MNNWVGLTVVVGLLACALVAFGCEHNITGALIIVGMLFFAVGWAES